MKFAQNAAILALCLVGSSETKSSIMPSFLDTTQYEDQVKEYLRKMMRNPQGESQSALLNLHYFL